MADDQRQVRKRAARQGRKQEKGSAGRDDGERDEEWRQYRIQAKERWVAVWFGSRTDRGVVGGESEMMMRSAAVVVLFGFGEWSSPGVITTSKGREMNGRRS